ncbi:hypothetical protein LTR66_000088 [Elasticomyces elasticus]|nr:hypothetical protein LTR28_003697 [Elasticomyces elasticus]KAK5001210.1 hypothetical protein LTR66_000088 [Elasticomyces elasticus]
MPAGTVTVLYPSDTKFDMDYYVNKHMSLVQSIWGPAGLKSWKVLKFGKDDQFSVQATLEWDSPEAFQKAVAGPKTGEVMDDIKNFSDKNPVIMSGEVTGTSKL